MNKKEIWPGSEGRHTIEGELIKTEVGALGPRDTASTGVLMKSHDIAMYARGSRVTYGMSPFN